MSAPFGPVSGLWTVAAGFALGAVIGSFLATILIRWPAGLSVRAGRSRCDGCAAGLRAHELVPILSFLFASGRCRRCGVRIDRRHLAIELAAAFIGALSLWGHPGAVGLVTAIFGWWLLILAALDLEEQWLPDILTLPLIPAGLVAAMFAIGPALEDRVIGAAAGFAVLWLVGLCYKWLRARQGLGGGDPKLLAAIGAWLGWQHLPLVLLGAGLIGLASILSKRLKGREVRASDRLPLGTLMALAAWPLWLVVAAGS